MTLWIILTIMTAMCAVWAAWPFLRRAGAGEISNEAARSSAVYRDQLRQIDAELEAGVINEAEAQATRSEVARRLILAERDERALVEPAQFGDRSFAAIGIAGVVALGSAILYASIGEPDRVPRVQAAGNMLDGNMGALPSRHPPVSDSAAFGRTQPSSSAEEQRGGQGTGLPTVDELIARLEQRLKANPEDADGWRMLGWSFASQGKFKEASAAYEEAIKRQPENGDLYAARGEIMVREGNGFVSPEAANLFEEALKRDKEQPSARFFLGLKKMQAGDGKAALDDWIAILQGAPPSEPWAHDLKERVVQLAAELKVDLAGRLPVVPPAAQTGETGTGAPNGLQEERRVEAPPPAKAAANVPGSNGPSTAGAQQASATSPEDRSDMIRSMVDRLASRLETQPRDLEGWSRLIRSRTVMGEMDKAKTALAKAREIFADTPDALTAIGATASELGLEP